MMKHSLMGVAAAAFALAVAPAAHATDFNVGDPNFFLTSGTPFSPTITAVFYNVFDGSQAFDDTFFFTIPQNGVGSGSISTSFATPGNMLTITDLIINGISYAVTSTPQGYSATVNGVQILSGVLNTIQVKGFTVGTGNYAGTATFEATAVPEPATWAFMLLGFGAIGLVARSRARSTRVSFS